MKTYTFTGEFLAAKLRQELVTAGVPEQWVENGESYALVVQVDEDLAVAIEEPVLDADYNLVFGKDGKPVTDIVWQRPDGETVKVPAKLVPDEAAGGTHIQLGPDTVTVYTADTVTETVVKKVVDVHDPTPPTPPPSLEQRVAALENVASVKAELATGKKQ